MLGARVVPGIPVERARIRTTLTYQLTDELSAGIEWNPLADDVGILANWRVFGETESRPALILGTSSDRIGTDMGRSFYGTLSKDLEAWTGLPIGPYVGASYGQADDELVPIGGLSVRWSDRITSFHLWDGHNVHHVVETSFDRHTLGLMLVDLDGSYYAGITYSVSFGGSSGGSSGP